MISKDLETGVIGIEYTEEKDVPAKPKGSHYCLILNITPVVFGIRNVAMHCVGGAPFPSSNFISYVTTR